MKESSGYFVIICDIAICFGCVALITKNNHKKTSLGTINAMFS